MRAVILTAVIAAANAGGQIVDLRPYNNALRYQNGVMDMSADGNILLGWQDFGPSLWDIRTSTVATLPDGTRQGVCITPDGSIYILSFLRRCTPAGCADLPTATDAPGYNLLAVYGISNDGRVMSGHANSPSKPAVLTLGQPAQVAPSYTVLSTYNVVSGDGSTAYFPVSTGILRWRQGVWTLIPAALTVRTHLIGCSVDGSVVYLSELNSLRRYQEGVGLVAVEGLPADLQLQAITPDGRRGVGQMPIGGQSTYVLWEPFAGVQSLGVPAFSIVTISDDGRTVAGTRPPQGANHAFYMRVPPPVRGLDYSRDGNVDQNDVAVFVDLVAGAPNTLALPLDFNDDGNTDADDVSDLINCIAGGCP